MRTSIIAYKFNGERGNWCGGVIRDGTEPICDSARDGIGFKTRAEALAWAREQKEKLEAMAAAG